MVRVINFYMLFQVSKEDDLPKGLCAECAKTVQLLYKFRKQVFESEKEFKKYIDYNIEITVKHEEELNLKVESDNENNDYYDPYEVFSQDENLLTDVKEEKQYQCNICQKQFSKESKLLKHELVHEKSPFPCNLCKRYFQKQSSLDKHLKKHSNSYYNCNMCLESFSTEALLSEHMKIHFDIEVKTEKADEKNYPCSVCNLAFTKSRSLAMHMRKHKSKSSYVKLEKQVFKCDLCMKEFSTKSMLRRHMKLHSSVQPLACPKCPKRYTRQDQLQEHMKKHDSGKPNICTYCSKGMTFNILSLRIIIRWSVFIRVAR